MPGLHGNQSTATAVGNTEVPPAKRRQEEDTVSVGYKV